MVLQRKEIIEGGKSLRSRRMSSRCLGEGVILLRNCNTFSIMTRGKSGMWVPAVSKSVGIVVGRSVLIWVLPADHETKSCV